MTADALSADDRRALLRQVEFLAPLDDVTLDELVAGGESIDVAPGHRIVSALESGADVYVVLAGRADIVVEPRGGKPRVIHTLGPGSAFGEMASLTGELRSATVLATEPARLLVIADAEFDRLRERRPEVAVAMLRMLGRRLAAADRAIDGLLAPGDAGRSADAIAGAPVPIERGSLRRIWRELVVNHHRDLPFMTLAAFVITLIAVRVIVYTSFRLDIAPHGVLRAAYMTGFGLLFASAATALLTFRPLARKLVAIAYGIGAALIFNELGVTLAFDIFFKDIHTADPNVPFDIERLYRRTEPLRAIVIGLIVLIQAVYLRGFYRRAWFIARTAFAARTPRRRARSA
jgi:CRP-like cAMP-binding protein